MPGAPRGGLQAVEVRNVEDRARELLKARADLGLAEEWDQRERRDDRGLNVRLGGSDGVVGDRFEGGLKRGVRRRSGFGIERRGFRHARLSAGGAAWLRKK